MPAVAPGTPPEERAGVRKGPSTTLIAVIAVIVAAGGAGVALALAAGGNSAHAVSHALTGAATASRGVSRIFHAPGDNVTCEVRANGALCSVASNNQTFVLPENGEASHTESGLALSTGSGSLASYGTSVSLGPVTCVIPMEREPRGIVCNDSVSGHGFEASQDASRQKTY
jgi:hypothetical protein